MNFQSEVLASSNQQWRKSRTGGVDRRHCRFLAVSLGEGTARSGPAQRLFALDATPTIAGDEAIAQERPFELRPALMGPAITSEVLMMAEEDALHMPALESA
jgi:hypothetical protein